MPDPLADLLHRIWAEEYGSEGPATLETIAARLRAAGVTPPASAPLASARIEAGLSDWRAALPSSYVRSDGELARLAWTDPLAPTPGEQRQLNEDLTEIDRASPAERHEVVAEWTRRAALPGPTGHLDELIHPPEEPR